MSTPERRPGWRRDHYSPSRRDHIPNDTRNMRCPDCDFTSSSMENLKAHFHRTRHKPRGDRRTWNTALSRRTDRQRGPDYRHGGEPNRERNETDRQRKLDSMPSNETDQQKKPDPTTSSVPDNQKKPDPAPSGVPGMVPDHIRRSIFVLQDYISRKEREPIIGLEYILEYKVQVRYDKIDIKYFCEICEMDSGVVPMVDHLCGFKHRKLYVAKEYPYVLKALFSTKEDKAVFMRRMAMEIEQEEGTKTYKTDPVIRMVSVMNVKSTEAKQSKRRTRWDPEGDRQRKMEQALEFLDLYKIDNEDSETTVTKLLEKLSAKLKTHTDKIREEALFPAKVARAREVAVSIMRNALRAWMMKRNLSQRPPGHRLPSLLDKELLENINLGRFGGPFQPNHANFPQWPQGSPFFQLIQKHNDQMADNSWKDHPADLQIGQDDEDIQFLKKLMELLDVLPDNLTQTDDPEMDPGFLLLKSLLLDKTENLEAMPAKQLMELASLVQGLTSMENVPQNRMPSKNPAAKGDFGAKVSMQMASTANNAVPVENIQLDQNLLMQIATLLQNHRKNINSILPESRKVQNREHLVTGNSSGMPMKQTSSQRPYTDQQPGYASASRVGDDFGYDGRRAGIYGNNNKSRFDDTGKPLGYGNEQSRDTYTDRSFGKFSRDWDMPPYRNMAANPEYEDYAAGRAPFTRVTKSPNTQRLELERSHNDVHNHDLRRDIRLHETGPIYGAHGARPFNEPAWAERDNDMHYAKRPRLDGDHISVQSAEWGRGFPDDSESSETNSAKLSVDLLKRIRGKDLFTVSAILSEYAENH